MFGLQVLALLCAAIMVAVFLGAIGGVLIRRFGHRRKAVSIVAGSLIAFLSLSGILGYWFFYLPNDYYRYAGDFDYYRMPLDYPYELSMIDMIDCATISVWKENTSLMGGIRDYQKRDNVIIGTTSISCRSAERTGWFSFDTRTGDVVTYFSPEEFKAAARLIYPNEEIKLLTVRENWDLHWD